MLSAGRMELLPRVSLHPHPRSPPRAARTTAPRPPAGRGDGAAAARLHDALAGAKEQERATEDREQRRSPCSERAGSAGARRARAGRAGHAAFWYLPPSSAAGRPVPRSLNDTPRYAAVTGPAVRAWCGAQVPGVLLSGDGHREPSFVRRHWRGALLRFRQQGFLARIRIRHGGFFHALGYLFHPHVGAVPRL
jgi:hypothetical protein